MNLTLIEWAYLVGFGIGYGIAVMFQPVSWEQLGWNLLGILLVLMIINLITKKVEDNGD